MQLEYKGGFNPIIAKMLRARQQMEGVAKDWAKESAEDMKVAAIAHLETQGRGGEPPPLSPNTIARYNATKWPDGSGIRDHIDVVPHGSGCAAVIPEGEHAMIARVQDRGATIPSAGGYIIVPGRRFWRASWATVKRSSKQKLKRVGAVWK